MLNQTPPEDERWQHRDKPTLRQAQLVMLRILKVVDEICQRHNIPYWLEAGTLLGAVRHKGFIPWDDDLDISMLRDDFNRFIQVAPQELPSDIFLQTNETDPHYFNIGCPLKLRDKYSVLLEPHEELSDQHNKGIYIDIFPYDNMLNSAFERAVYVFISKKLLKVLRARTAPRSLGFAYQCHRALAAPFSTAFLKKIMNWIIKRSNAKPLPVIGYGYDFRSKRQMYPREVIFPTTKVVLEGYEFSAPANVDQFLGDKFGDYMKLPPKHDQVPGHTKLLVPIVEKEDGE